MGSEDTPVKNMKSSRLRKDPVVHWKVEAREEDDTNSGPNTCDEDNVPLVQLPKLRKSDVFYRRNSSPSSCNVKKAEGNEGRRNGAKDHMYQRSVTASEKKGRAIHTEERPLKPKANLGLLGINTLWRYWTHFNLGSFNSKPTEEEMFNAVQQHFAWQKLEETEVIERFINAAKRLKIEDSRGKEEGSLQSQYLMDEELPHLPPHSPSENLHDCLPPT